MLGEAALTGADALRYLDAYEAGDPRDRQGGGRPRRPRRPRHFGQALGAAPALRPRAARARAGASCCRALVDLRAARAALRHRLQHRRRGGRPARPVAGRARGARARSASLAGWDGLGFVVQAYQKRARPLVDWIVALARSHEPAADGAPGQGRVLGHRDQARAGRRPRRLSGVHAQGPHRRRVPRLRQGAARRRRRGLPAVRHAQRAHHRRGRPRSPATGRFEFQCLHGMGETLYDQVVGAGGKLDRPCRIYAPVGAHETLLAYLVRRLLENGANTSFVNRIVDLGVPIVELVADPVAQAAAHRRRAASAHPLPAAILARPRATPPASTSPATPTSPRSPPRMRTLAVRSNFGQRRSSAVPRDDGPDAARYASADAREIRHPADRGDLVGTVVDATLADADARGRRRRRGRRAHGRRLPAAERAAILERAADLMEAEMPSVDGACGARGRQDAAQRRRRSPRGRRLLPLLRRARRAASSPIRRSTPIGPVVASRRGTSRWRSSPARSPPRSPPAIPWSPSPPSRRR